MTTTPETRPYGTATQQVPILVAGAGPRMLRIAGEHADIAALGVPFDAEADGGLRPGRRPSRRILRHLFETA